MDQVADDTGESGIVGSAAETLTSSMRDVAAELSRADGVPAAQLIEQIREWERLVESLAGGAAQGIELAALYEASQTLSSSLDLKETLSIVMELLIHLTGAERGCLMLLDEEGNLAIRAARHFDDYTAVPEDLELSQTVVGDVVDKGTPVVTTNAQLDPRFSEQESVIGYHLRSIVCVPLHVRGKVIGALYLDNRIREGVFSEGTLPMLTAFANQAAVAIENARLYTVTDQALAARVDELTTLQQVDRDLNASLDLDEVLRLTLSWALKATGAGEGYLSLLEGEAVFKTVSSKDGAPAAELGTDLVRLVKRNEEPVMVGGLRMLVPVRYEDRVVGVLDLHNSDSVVFRREQSQLAWRLADHAAIAIENARLYEEVRSANMAKSEFVSFVAHELRTPMTSIRGYADMLRKGMVGTLEPQQEEFIRIICNNVERMQVLVADLQDVSRIESGQLRLEVQSTSLAEALDSALQATRGQIEDRSQELAVNVPQDLQPVRADPARLTQIFINLLSNARKYTPEGGHVGVNVRVENGYVRCAVSDTGVGISPADQAYLFTKFFRSEDPAVREMPGTGLGLCIVKSLVEMQGGEIEVASQIGKGTTFTFTVPIAGSEGSASLEQAGGV